MWELIFNEDEDEFEEDECYYESLETNEEEKQSQGNKVVENVKKPVSSE